MGERAQALAAQFEQANAEAIALVEGCSDEQWRAPCGDEGRSVGVVAHHVAGAHRAIARWVQTLASGEPVPTVEMAAIDEGNARHAERHADCTREETAALLRRNGEAAAGMVRGLDDAQLERSAALFAGEPSRSAADVIERRLIGHVRSHLASIRATIGAR